MSEDQKIFLPQSQLVWTGSHAQFTLFRPSGCCCCGLFRVCGSNTKSGLVKRESSKILQEGIIVSPPQRWWCNRWCVLQQQSQAVALCQFPPRKKSGQTSLPSLPFDAQVTLFAKHSRKSRKRTSKLALQNLSSSARGQNRVHLTKKKSKNKQTDKVQIET